MGLRVSRISAALGLTLALAVTAQAQTSRFHLGPRLSYQFDLKKLGVRTALTRRRHLVLFQLAAG
jgi:hypothetical protein